MDWLAFFAQLMTASPAPLLPAAGWMHVSQPLAWALLSGCGASWLLHRRARWERLAGTGLAMAWALWPGSVSSSYWLGLAFQAPSLTTMLLCVWALSPGGRAPGIQGGSNGLGIWRWAGVVLGWMLLLDTLAWLPGWQLYALGFSPIATLLVAIGALLAGAAGHFGPKMEVWRVMSVLWLPLAVFVGTRLPSGNLWDALLDPWLWLWLQGDIVWRGVRRIRAHRPVAPATRA